MGTLNEKFALEQNLFACFCMVNMVTKIRQNFNLTFDHLVLHRCIREKNWAGRFLSIWQWCSKNGFKVLNCQRVLEVHSLKIHKFYGGSSQSKPLQFENTTLSFSCSEGLVQSSRLCLLANQFQECWEEHFTNKNKDALGVEGKPHYNRTAIFFTKWVTKRPCEKGKLQIESKFSEGQWKKEHKIVVLNYISFEVCKIVYDRSQIRGKTSKVY